MLLSFLLQVLQYSIGDCLVAKGRNVLAWSIHASPGFQSSTHGHQVLASPAGSRLWHHWTLTGTRQWQKQAPVGNGHQRAADITKHLQAACTLSTTGQWAPGISARHHAPPNTWYHQALGIQMLPGSGHHWAPCIPNRP